MSSEHSNSGAAEQRRNFTIFIALGIITIIEYFVGLSFNSPALLMILAFAKTALIVNFFMHVYRLWREEAH